MSDFLLGTERSGTPIETRGGTEDIAAILRNLLRTGDAGGVGRLTSQAQVSSLGFDPSELNIGELIQSMLVSPADRTAGLFAAEEPFQRRQVEENVAGLRGVFGQAGGRFSRNAADAEAVLRGELAGQFARSREQSLLDANTQLQQFVQGLIGLSNQGRTNAIAEQGNVLSFFQPGETNIQQGALADIIGLLALAAASKG